MFCHFTEYFGGQFCNYIDDIDYMNVKSTFFFQDRFHDKLKKGKIFEILNKHLSLINLKSVHLLQNLPYATTKKFEKTRKGVGKNLVKLKNQ